MPGPSPMPAKRNATPRAKAAFLNHVRKLTYGVAAGYYRKHGGRVEFEDLFQAACLGAIYSLDRYDGACGASPKTYARFWIRNYVRREAFRQRSRGLGKVTSRLLKQKMTSTEVPVVYNEPEEGPGLHEPETYDREPAEDLGRVWAAAEQVIMASGNGQRDREAYLRAFLLKYRDGRTYAEIAVALGVAHKQQIDQYITKTLRELSESPEFQKLRCHVED